MCVVSVCVCGECVVSVCVCGECVCVCVCGECVCVCVPHHVLRRFCQSTCEFLARAPGGCVALAQRPT